MNLYFDNAATSSPKPQIVLDRIQAALTEFNANPGRSGHPAALAAARESAVKIAGGAESGAEQAVRIVVFGSFVTVTAALEVFAGEGIAR